MLTKSRLRTADPALVAYCPKCRNDRADALDDPCDDDQELRCPKCGDLLELAEKTVTDVPTEAVDMRAICEEEGLPPSAITFHRLTCTRYSIVEETRPL